jgi:hypothetical protein
MKKEFIEGVHYYMENGMIVFTEKYLLERGKCCNKNCRHCPYNSKDVAKNNLQKVTNSK